MIYDRKSSGRSPVTPWTNYLIMLIVVRVTSLFSAQSLIIGVILNIYSNKDINFIITRRRGRVVKAID